MANITRINENNIDLFLPMLPDSIIREIDEDETMVIFGIESMGFAAGVSAVSILPPDAEITWYYLDPKFRGMGEGSESFIRLMRCLREDFKCDNAIMNLYAGCDEHLSRLFDGLAASYEIMPGCRFDTTMGRLRNAEKLSGKSKNCVSLSEVDNKKLLNLCNELVEEREDLVKMPVVPDDYLKDMSAVYLKDGEARGMLLVEKNGEGLEIAYIASLENSISPITDMMQFVREKTGRISEDTPVVMNLVNERFETLLKKLLEISDEEEEGFTYNERAVLPLDFVDTARQEAEGMIEMWRKLDEIKTGGKTA